MSALILFCMGSFSRATAAALVAGTMLAMPAAQTKKPVVCAPELREKALPAPVEGRDLLEDLPEQFRTSLTFTPDGFTRLLESSCKPVYAFRVEAAVHRGLGRNGLTLEKHAEIYGRLCEGPAHNIRALLEQPPSLAALMQPQSKWDQKTGVLVDKFREYARYVDEPEGYLPGVPHAPLFRCLLAGEECRQYIAGDRKAPAPRQGWGVPYEFDLPYAAARALSLTREPLENDSLYRLLLNTFGKSYCSSLSLSRSKEIFVGNPLCHPVTGICAAEDPGRIRESARVDAEYFGKVLDNVHAARRKAGKPVIAVHCPEDR